MKTKKLTALISAIIISVCTVSTASSAENMMGDMNRNGIIDGEDADLLYDYACCFAESDVSKYTPEEHEFYMIYGDLNGDFKIDNEDLILLGELTSDITKNTKMGDINHDGFINNTDYIIISNYNANIATGQYDNYTEEEHENFKKYGDMNNDGMVNAMDAGMIITISENKIIGDMNLNDIIDSEDVQILTEYIEYLKTYGTYTPDGKYSDTEYYLNKIYGDLNEDGIVDDSDLIILKELQNNTTTNNKKGDANEDGKINISDAVLIMQSLSAPSEYSLSEQGAENADVVDEDGVTSKDALAIQMIDAKLIDISDLPVTSDQINPNI